MSCNADSVRKFRDKTLTHNWFRASELRRVSAETTIINLSNNLKVPPSTMRNTQEDVRVIDSWDAEEQNNEYLSGGLCSGLSPSETDLPSWLHIPKGSTHPQGISEKSPGELDCLM